MKKILLIGILFSLALCVNAQKYAEYCTFYLNAGDSVVVTKKDKIACIAWSIPESSQDSIQVWGGEKGFLGRKPEPVAYRVSEDSALGYNDQIGIKYAKIKAYTRVRITIIPMRD